MATLEMPPGTDIETGRRSSAVKGDGDDEGDRSPLFTAAGPSDCPVGVESGENKDDSEKVERECRICQLSLICNSPGPGCSPGPLGVAIELGCSCKDDLAAAHKHCAETWFKIKGNKICEICNATAQNVTVTIEIEQQGSETFGTTASRPSNAAAQRCLNGHRFLNFMLACMVFAFVISWLFHFNISSQ